jgi:tripartite-type tricarboxylate transporter receptor subunit TctC
MQRPHPVLPILLAAFGLLPAAAIAEGNYPARPIRILIPYPAGGGADLVGRTLGERLAAQLGQTVVVDNRPGAGGNIATELAVRGEPDGHTLLVGAIGPIAINPSLYRKLAYDPIRDLAPISRTSEVLNVMVVNPSIGVKTAKEFIDWAKKRPAGDVRFGTSGAGAPDHLAPELFLRMAGINMTHVPYKGGGPALLDLASNQLHVVFATVVVANPHVKSGKLRAIATTSPNRQPLLADLPTIAESGLPGFGINNWYGLFAPAKTPGPVIDRLNAEVNKALKAPELKDRQNGAGIEPVGSTAAEFAAFVRTETQRWAKVIADAKISIE